MTVDLADPGAPDPRRPRSDVVLGTPRDELITTGNGDDVICGGAGDDYVRAGAGGDLVIGGAGSDTIDYQRSARPIRVDLRITGAQRTGLGSDTLRGVENVTGADRFPNHLVGRPGPNDLRGGEAADHLHGRGGDDGIFGEDGDNVLRGGGDDDHIEGWDGDDLVHGGHGDDQIGGFVGDDLLRGGPGADVLVSYGPTGQELLYGGPGDDFLLVSTSDELLAGGGGTDVVFFLSGNDPTPVTVDLAVEGPQETGQGTDQLVDVEGLVGTYGDDVLYGDGGPNIMDGGYGNGVDHVDGRDGADVCGEDPADTFVSCEEFGPRMPDPRDP